MNDMPFQLQNPKVSHASGRLLTDPDFSRVWNASGVRPSATGAMEGNVCIVRCSATEVRISLDMIPTDEASCPISQTAESMAELHARIGLPAPRFPYPVDFETRFFIPAGAISCVLEDGARIYCEGVFDAVDKSIRIDAVDQERYSWFYAEARLL